MSIDTSVLTCQARNRSDKDLNMKLNNEDNGVYVDTMRHVDSDSDVEINCESDVRERLEPGHECVDREPVTEDPRQSPDPKRRPPSDTNTSQIIDGQPINIDHTDSKSELYSDNINTHNVNSLNNVNHQHNVNTHNNVNMNDIKVRTTAFSVSDILDPTKFVGGCGVQKVWHPWIRDEGVRDYTKSNLNKSSDNCTPLGKTRTCDFMLTMVYTNLKCSPLVLAF